MLNPTCHPNKHAYRNVVPLLDNRYHCRIRSLSDHPCTCFPHTLRSDTDHLSCNVGAILRYYNYHYSTPIHSRCSLRMMSPDPVGRRPRLHNFHFGNQHQRCKIRLLNALNTGQNCGHIYRVGSLHPVCMKHHQGNYNIPHEHRSLSPHHNPNPAYTPNTHHRSNTSAYHSDSLRFPRTPHRFQRKRDHLHTYHRRHIRFLLKDQNFRESQDRR